MPIVNHGKKEIQTTQFLQEKVWISISGKGGLCRKLKKCLHEIFSMAQGVPSGINFIGLLSVMQSDENLYKTGRIVDCNIVYVMFFIICNSIINRTKKMVKGLL